MIQKNRTTIIAAFLIAAVSLSFGASASFRDKGDFDPAKWGEKHGDFEANHAEIQAAIESGDYEAWSALVAESPFGETMLENINEDNFPQLVEATSLMQDAKELMEESRAIMEELGFDKSGFHGKKGGFGRKFGGHKFGDWNK